jgi:hypothetical protein
MGSSVRNTSSSAARTEVKRRNVSRTCMPPPDLRAPLNTPHWNTAKN